jgi:hypothetical protein
VGLARTKDRTGERRLSEREQGVNIVFNTEVYYLGEPGERRSRISSRICV